MNELDPRRLKIDFCDSGVILHHSERMTPFE
jgi:hypothetical protein